MIYGPSFGWFMSQSYSLRFPRINRAAASNSSGVVGSTGRKTPSMPRPREISPNIVRSIFIDSFADAKIMKFLTDTAVCRTFRSNCRYPYIGRHLAEWAMETKALLINDLKSFRWGIFPYPSKPNLMTLRELLRTFDLRYIPPDVTSLQNTLKDQQ